MIALKEEKIIKEEKIMKEEKIIKEKKIMKEEKIIKEENGTEEDIYNIYGGRVTRSTASFIGEEKEEKEEKEKKEEKEEKEKGRQEEKVKEKEKEKKKEKEKEETEEEEEKNAKKIVKKIENLLHMDIGRQSIKKLLQNKERKNARKEKNKNINIHSSFSYLYAAKHILKLKKKNKLKRICLVCFSPSNISNDPPLAVDGIHGVIALCKFFTHILHTKCLIITDACNQSIVHSMLVECADIKHMYRKEINSAGKIPLLLNENYMIELKSYIPIYGWNWIWQKNLENVCEQCDAFISVHRAGEGMDGKCWLLRGLCMTQYIAPLDCVFYKQKYIKSKNNNINKLILKEKEKKEEEKDENTNILLKEEEKENIEKKEEYNNNNNNNNNNKNILNINYNNDEYFSSSSVDEVEESMFLDAEDFNKILKNKKYKKKNRKICFHSSHSDKTTVAIGCTGNELGMGACFCSSTSFSSSPSLQFAKNATKADFTLVAHSCSWGCYGLLCIFFVLIANEKFNKKKKINEIQKHTHDCTQINNHSKQNCNNNNNSNNNSNNNNNNSNSNNNNNNNSNNNNNNNNKNVEKEKEEEDILEKKKKFVEHFFLSEECNQQIHHFILKFGILDERSLCLDRICNFEWRIYRSFVAKMQKLALRFVYKNDDFFNEKYASKLNEENIHEEK